MKVITGNTNIYYIGAACQLLFLGMAGVECLSGEEAISRGINEINVTSPVPISLRCKILNNNG